MILERDEPFKTKFHGFTGVDANSEFDSAMGKIIGVSNLTLHEAMSRKGKLDITKISGFKPGPCNRPNNSCVTTSWTMRPIRALGKPKSRPTKQCAQKSVNGKAHIVVRKN